MTALNSAWARETTERFLVVAVSDASAERIALRASALAAAYGSPGLVYRVADCGDKRAIFAWTAEVLPTAEEARAVLARLKPQVPDSYVKRCLVLPGSLLAVGRPAVDASIARVPTDAVNWSDADRVSSIVSIGEAGQLLLTRYFEHARDDPLEGRRTRVSLSVSPGEWITLLENCSGVRSVAHFGQWLAFACDTEQAADHVLHTVHVFTGAGSSVTTLPRCRQPVMSAPDVLTCQTESVDGQGRLRLKAQVTRLSAR